MSPIFYISLGSGITLLTGLLAYLFLRIKKVEDEPTEKEDAPAIPPPETGGAEAVGAFYDEQTDNFLKVYGEVIQAFRTTDVSKLLDYQMEVMEMAPGMKVLDAGCGVCGPAVYFAEHAKVEVEALTISEVQVKKAKVRIREKGQEGRVRVKQGDFHKLAQIYPHESFDRVYFLESFGHAHDKQGVLKNAFQVLKPGGMLYIKDLFVKEAVLAEHKEKIEQEVEKINQAYHYHIADFYEVMRHIRQLGFILAVVKTIDLKLEEFENLTISNDFQELTGIGKINNWDEYIFPVDFFEIICYRPHYKLEFGASRYFLQNLYHMKIWGKQQEEL